MYLFLFIAFWNKFVFFLAITLEWQWIQKNYLRILFWENSPWMKTFWIFFLHHCFRAAVHVAWCHSRGIFQGKNEWKSCWNLVQTQLWLHRAYKVSLSVLFYSFPEYLQLQPNFWVKCLTSECKSWIFFWCIWCIFCSWRTKRQHRHFPQCISLSFAYRFVFQSWSLSWCSTLGF